MRVQGLVEKCGYDCSDEYTDNAQCRLSITDDGNLDIEALAGNGECDCLISVPVVELLEFLAIADVPLLSSPRFSALIDSLVASRQIKTDSF